MAAVSKAIRYRIVHQTEYRYSEPVLICQNQLRMFPRSHARQTGSVTCHQLDTKILPEPDFVQHHTDYFGNRVYSFSVESPHDFLSVSVTSEVTVAETEIPIVPANLPWESVIAAVQEKTDDRWLEVQEFGFDSPRIHRDRLYSEYAAESFTPGRDLVAAGLDLTHRIHRDFAYDTNATDVNTPTERAFRLRAGVCQDFAQIQIACLRSIGLAAKYVSGYLRTTPPPGKPRLVGADESHAWVRVYAGANLGWIDFDPTNGCIANTNHVPTCLGRDYNDVSPMRGIITGSGQAELRVGVSMAEV